MVKVSIITPVYNVEACIEKCVKSVMNQTCKEFEFLLIDDGSKDKSIDIAKELLEGSDINYKIITQKNSGVSTARNEGIKKAVGEYITFLDSDDLWLPEKLEHQLKFMVENNYTFTYHEYTEISEEGTDLGVYVSGKKRVSKFDMYACCWPGCLSVMYDAEKIGLIQIKDVRKNNDTAMWLMVVKRVPCYLLKENLAKYRRRAVSITPKPLYQRIWAHYPLFHVAEEMNPVRATFWVVLNVFGNAFKKIFYVKRI